MSLSAQKTPAMQNLSEIDPYRGGAPLEKLKNSVHKFPKSSKFIFYLTHLLWTNLVQILRSGSGTKNSRICENFIKDKSQNAEGTFYSGGKHCQNPCIHIPFSGNHVQNGASRRHIEDMRDRLLSIWAELGRIEMTIHHLTIDAIVDVWKTNYIRLYSREAISP